MPPLDLSTSPFRKARQTGAQAFDLSTSPFQRGNPFPDGDLDLEGGHDVIGLMRAAERFTAPKIQQEQPDATFTPGAIQGPVAGPEKPLPPPFDPSVSYDPEASLPVKVGGLLKNALMSSQDMILGALYMPIMAAQDPKGTAWAIANFAPDQFANLLKADLLNVGEMVGVENPNFRAERDAARKQLYGDPLGPAFAFQITKAMGGLAAKGLGKVQTLRNAKQAVLEETADLLLEPPQPIEPPVKSAPGEQLSMEGFTKAGPPTVPKINVIEARMQKRNATLLDGPEVVPPAIDMPSVNWFQRFVANVPRTATEAKGVELAQQRVGELQLRRHKVGDFVKEARQQFSKEELSEMRWYRQKTNNPYTDAAPKLSAKAKAFVDEVVGPRFEKLFKEMEEAGYFTDAQHLDNFISQFWVLSRKKGASGKAFGNLVTRARLGRKIPTYHEGIKGGKKPLHDNILDDLAAYEEYNTRVIVNNELIRGLRQLADADGNAMVTPLTQKTRHLMEEGWNVVDNKALNRAVYVTRKGSKGKATTLLKYPATLVHESLKRPVDAVFTEPFSGTVYKHYRNINAAAKAMNLTLSFFHPFALAESSLGAGGVKGPFMWKRGLRLMKDPAFVEESIKNGGVNYGASVDVGRSIVRNMMLRMEARAKGKPIVGQAATGLRAFKDVWDRKLWDEYHAGLKAIAYHTWRAKMLEKYPDVHPRIISSEVGKLVNDSFGGQNWERMLTNPHVTEALHATFLAPDWGISALRQAGAAFESSFTGKLRGKAAGLPPEAMQQLVLSSELRGVMGRRHWARMAGYSFLGMQMLNYIGTALDPGMDAHFTWDNDPGKELGIVIPRLGIPLVAPGKASKGDPVNYAHPLKQMREIVRWVTDLPQNLGSKSAPVLRWGMEQLTQHDAGSGFPSEWAQEDEDGIKPTFLESIPARSKRTLQYFVPYSFGGHNYAFTLPRSQGMTPYRFRQEYARAFKDEDQGQMERLKLSAVMNGIPAKKYIGIIRSIRRKQTRVRREE